MGWPCHLGGAVEVVRAALTERAKPRNCIVFYSPEPAPNLKLRDRPRTVVQNRVAIYSKVAESCVAAAQKVDLSFEPVALTAVADCIMHNYPTNDFLEDLPKVTYRLSKARGVVVYVKYDMPGIADDIGLAVPEGQVVQNCYPITFPASLSLVPVRLCHAALMSATETPDTPNKSLKPRKRSKKAPHMPPEP